jgi:hypothetical protein
MTEPTTEKLAKALREAGASLAMIIRAKDGYYDDYRSPLATPMMQLYADLMAEGKRDLAERVAAGEFDATKEEADAWAASPEGQATFREFLKGG